MTAQKTAARETSINEVSFCALHTSDIMRIMTYFPNRLLAAHSLA